MGVRPVEHFDDLRFRRRAIDGHRVTKLRIAGGDIANAEDTAIIEIGADFDVDGVEGYVHAREPNGVADGEAVAEGGAVEDAVDSTPVGAITMEAPDWSRRFASWWGAVAPPWQTWQITAAEWVSRG